MLETETLVGYPYIQMTPSHLRTGISGLVCKFCYIFSSNLNNPDEILDSQAAYVNIACIEHPRSIDVAADSRNFRTSHIEDSFAIFLSQSAF